MKTYNGYEYSIYGKRLITVSKIIHYTYDLEGLIIKKVDINNTTTTTNYYYYDNRTLIKEVKGNNIISMMPMANHKSNRSNTS